jgi:hypothetical protein
LAVIGGGVPLVSTSRGRQKTCRPACPQAARYAAEIVAVNRNAAEIDAKISVQQEIVTDFELHISGWHIEHRPSGHAGFLSRDPDAYGACSRQFGTR